MTLTTYFAFVLNMILILSDVFQIYFELLGIHFRLNTAYILP